MQFQVFQGSTGENYKIPDLSTWSLHPYLDSEADNNFFITNQLNSGSEGKQPRLMSQVPNPSKPTRLMVTTKDDRGWDNIP